MKKNILTLGLSTCVLVTALTTTANANTMANANSMQGENFGVNLKLSTLGAGAEFVYKALPTLDVVGGVHKFGFDYETEENSVQYDGEIDLNSMALSARYHPAENGFFLGAGVAINNNEVNLTAQPSDTGSFEFNGQTYSASQIGSATSKVAFKKMAPQLSIGWQSMNKGLGFFTELGVMLTGEPELTANVQCGSSVPEAECNKIKDDVEKERKDLEEETNINLWPIVSLGIQYRF